MSALGVTAEEIDIRPAATQMLTDMGHPFGRGEPVYDVTFENVQAGLRTDYLFRLANQHNGFVIGTGDLSELALGWCTYGVGDQMAHYNVNAGVPKTLIQYLIRWVIASGQFDAERRQTLRVDSRDRDLARTRARAEAGEKPQSTEAKVGPYELQDFNLYYTLRFGFRPSKIAFLALHAWSDAERGAWPPGFPEDRRRSYDLAHDPALARRVRRALLRLQPVQALGHAERPQGRGRRIAVAARRLARALRRQRASLARRSRTERSEGLKDPGTAFRGLAGRSTARLRPLGRRRAIVVDFRRPGCRS